MDIVLNESTYNSHKKEYGVTSAVSHVFLTPITCILGFNQLLNLTNLTAEQKEYVQNIEKSTHKLLSVLDHVLVEIKQCEQQKSLPS